MIFSSLSSELKTKSPSKPTGGNSATSSAKKEEKFNYSARFTYSCLPNPGANLFLGNKSNGFSQFRSGGTGSVNAGPYICTSNADPLAEGEMNFRG